ncbi:hypothetical protein [Holdemania massiliensis]|nr:hypothetical protein [Holdemania massiliensis]
MTKENLQLDNDSKRTVYELSGKEQQSGALVKIILKDVNQFLRINLRDHSALKIKIIF